ncbi:hypothetical protein J4234_06850 [Candidatus Woesearchaeota archaeon]|nr:hypothetical protein [Candidatus Woesearchaeota archaeon]
MKKLILIVTLIFILGCVQAKDFDYGLKQVNSLNSKYNTTMETYPKTMQKVSLMLNDMEELKKLQLETGQEPFGYIVDYRILNLEAEKLYIESQKYGSAGTTKDGFGCKTRPLITESVALRNMSALKGFEAAGLITEFVGKYPKEAESAGFSLKNALFLNASFYEISQDARRDSRVINNFCPQNVTLELYQEEFRKKTNLSEDSIKKMRYEEAVPIWKKIRGIG